MALNRLDKALAPPSTVLNWYKTLVTKGAPPSLKACRSLLAQCLGRGRDDAFLLESALQALDTHPPWEQHAEPLWNTLTCNQYLQTAFLSRSHKRIDDVELLTKAMINNTSNKIPCADEATLVILIKGYGALGDVGRAEAAHKLLASGAVTPRTDRGVSVVDNALLSIYAQEGLLDEAELLSARIKKWDAFTLNTMLGLSANAQDLARCRDLWSTHAALLAGDDKARAIGYSLMTRVLTDFGCEDEALALLRECPVGSVGTAIAFSLGRRAFSSDARGPVLYEEQFQRASADVAALRSIDAVLVGSGGGGVGGALLSSLLSAYASSSSLRGAPLLCAYFLATRPSDYQETDEGEEDGRVISSSSSLAFLPLEREDIVGPTRTFNLLLLGVAECLSEHTQALAQGQGQGQRAALEKARTPIFSSPAALWAFTRALMLRRLAAYKGPGPRPGPGSGPGSGSRGSVDEASLTSSLSACAAADDLEYASLLFTQFTTNKKEKSNRSLPRPSQWLLHAYLRCFRRPEHAAALHSFLCPTALSSSTSATDSSGSGKSSGLESVVQAWRLRGQDRDPRLGAEAALAVMRVCGAPAALKFTLEAHASWCLSPSDNSHHSSEDSWGAALQNLCILHDRCWRDVDAVAPSGSDEPLSLLDGGSVPRVLLEQGDLLPLWPRPSPSPSSSPSPRQSAVEGRVLLGVLITHAQTQPQCKATVGQDLSRLKHLSALAAIVAAWLARGEHSLAAEALQCLALADLSEKESRWYSEEERAVVLLLAVCSAMSETFPLLSSAAPPALSKFLRVYEQRSAPGSGVGVASMLRLVDHHTDGLPPSAAKGRITCSAGDVVSFLELLCSSGASLPSIPASLILTLFSDAIAHGREGAARRIVRLLSTVRIVGREGGTEGQDLARTLAATLLGRSLNRVSARVAKSIGGISSTQPK